MIDIPWYVQTEADWIKFYEALEKLADEQADAEENLENHWW